MNKRSSAPNINTIYMRYGVRFFRNGVSLQVNLIFMPTDASMLIYSQ